MSDTDPRSDDALLAAYASGDQTAAAPLAQRHAPRILAMAARMLNDRTEAEDVTQDTLLRLWRKAPDWQPGRAQVSTWTFRVAANLCTDRLRKRAQLQPLEPEQDLPDTAPGTLARLHASQRRTALEDALQTLPDRQRLAVILRHIHELPNPQVAEAMEISVDAVESLTARGRAALARALAPRREALIHD
ncbi:sigma-70 family RNA polymerase sigma factor [Maribius pontilimi]|uniref:Sigma-70 family RNA polymerase sigma factor n=1 Tax=Palleronia pontilimi TaxID=1964209 RepID=A0A934MBE6_9RHOB|nr:sigma-70 family RNA polymerase sigma factor [Palleronia pontilimi]MBJ3761430.1 sigma-70 family RNA polymerase sigma factor [Palleronia pontilimi]